MENTIRAIIFDIGGTIVNKPNNGTRDFSVIDEMISFLNTNCSREDLINEILAGENAYKFWKTRTFIELPLAERWSKFLLPNYPESFIRQHADKLQDWWSKSKGNRWITSETIKTLEELGSRGYILATISHTSPKYLQEAGISQLFKTIQYAGDYGKRKPHPSIFLAAARNCGLSPQECAYVGDQPSRDIVGSREAGFGKIVLLQHADTTIEVEPCPMQADSTIENISELIALFPKIAVSHPVNNPTSEPPLLYDVGLSTMWWSKDMDNAEAFFNKGRQLGFARFELNHRITLEDFSSLNFKSYHMGSLHDPCPAIIPAKQLEKEDRLVTSLNEDLRQEGVEVVKRTIELAYKLGSRSVVIHPGRIIGDHSLDNQLRELYKKGFKGTKEYADLFAELIADRKTRSIPHLEALMKSLQEIVVFSENTGLMLGLENRLHYYELPIFNEMDTILTEFQQPWLGWQLDIGHLQVHNTLGLMSFEQWLKHFSHRIIGVHLHDVQGIIDHRVPGSGDVDFKMIGAHLPPFSQRTLEVDKSVTYEEIKTGMKFLAANGCVAQI